MEPPQPADKSHSLKDFLRIFSAVVAVIAVATVSLIIVTTWKKNHLKHVTAGSTAAVCNSSHCQEAASRIAKTMKIDADPCDDFYEFTCGNYLKDNSSLLQIEGRARWDSFSQAEDTIYRRGKVILEQESDPSDWPSIRKARLYYKSCMDGKRLEKLGVEPIKERLAAFGGWPVIGHQWSNESEYRWYEQVYKMSRHGFRADFILSIQVGTDKRNSSSRMLILDKPVLGMWREYLVQGFSSREVQHYHEYMRKAAILLGADPALAATEMKAALAFELELAQASSPGDERKGGRGSSNNTYAINEYPSLPGHPPSWSAYIDQLLIVTKTNPDDKVVVNDPDYMRNVSMIIDATPPRVIANYLGWRALKSAMPYLNAAARKIRQEYNEQIYGVSATSPSPRWKTCVQDVGFNSVSDASFRIPVSAQYVLRHFSPEAKEDTLEMIRYLRDGFRRNLDDLNWMDAKTRARAKKKLMAMDQFIAYPEELLDMEKVEKLYEGVEVEEGDLLGNVIRLSQWDQRYKFGLLRQKVEKKNWVDHSQVAVVNAYYQVRVNAMVFPAGILQGAFYNHLLPKYLNYGGIGAVIGHEMTHGFDDRGSQFDFEGNLKEWWEAETKKKFLNKTRCIVDQYSRYKSSQVNMSLNGATTQGENIADNGGVNGAFLAYEQWSKDNDLEEAKLPGLDFSPRQLFWISYGQVWCTKYQDAALKNLIKTDKHVPGMFRIIGPLSNSPQFASTFKCPEGSTMNPVKKCSVW